MFGSRYRIREYIEGSIYLSWSVLCLAILFFYSPNDPSLNHSTNLHTNHILGSFGSYSADLLLQLFGFAAYLLSIVPFIWSIKTYTSKGISATWLRIICLLIGVTLLSWSFVSYFYHFFSPNLSFVSSGGAIGDLINSIIGEVEDYVFYIAIALFIVIAFIALGIDFKEWYFLLQIIWQVILKFMAVLITTIKNVIIYCFNSIKNGTGNSNSMEEKFVTAETPIRRVGNVKKNIKPHVKQQFQGFLLPSTNLLNSYKKNKNSASNRILQAVALELTQVLDDFGIKGNIVNYFQGPVVTLYEFEPAAGTKSSRIIGLSGDVARTMKVVSTRIAVIPGKNSLGIELPNKAREIVYLKELLEDAEYSNYNHKLPIILGKDIGGRSIVVDLARMPHLLIAGTTGSGKSVAINTMILSLLFRHTPETCRFIMIDPKMLELSIYEGIPHLLAPVVTNPSKAVTALKWVVQEMENRYRLMSYVNVRNIENYNAKIKEAIATGKKLYKQVQTGFDPEKGTPVYETIEIEGKPLPFIVLVVDEMADLMIVAGKEIEASVQRLAQMARASGIHIIMATQRPSVDVITGVIKANFPTRVSFQVTSKIDSRTILGDSGAEQLLGRGDMLYMSGGEKIKRVHGPFVDDGEVEQIASFWKSQESPDYSVDITSKDSQSSDQSVSDEKDELYDQALALITRDQKVSTSYVQRYFKIGYNRAANIVEQMEKEGIIGAPGHTGKREVLVGK